MKNIIKKIMPKSFIEYFFAFIFFYFTLVIAFFQLFADNIGYPLLLLLQSAVPKDAGLGGGAMAVGVMIILVFATILLGLILTKIFTHKFSYFLVFMASLGFIIVFLAWNIQSYITHVNDANKRKENTQIGSQLSLVVDNCKIKAGKHPVYDYQVYNLICDVTVNNLELIDHLVSRPKPLLEIYYSGSMEDLPSEWKLAMIEEENGNFELNMSLGKNSKMPEIYIHKFVLNNGFDRYNNENFNLKVELNK